MVSRQRPPPAVFTILHAIGVMASEYLGLFCSELTRPVCAPADSPLLRGQVWLQTVGCWPRTYAGAARQCLPATGYQLLRSCGWSFSVGHPSAGGQGDQGGPQDDRDSQEKQTAHIQFLWMRLSFGMPSTNDLQWTIERRLVQDYCAFKLSRALPYGGITQLVLPAYHALCHSGQWPITHRHRLRQLPDTLRRPLDKIQTPRRRWWAPARIPGAMD